MPARSRFSASSSSTLTNLYNERPTWLDLAHKKLDAAVFAAYGWDPAMSDVRFLSWLAHSSSLGTHQSTYE